MAFMAEMLVDLGAGPLGARAGHSGGDTGIAQDCERRGKAGAMRCDDAAHAQRWHMRAHGIVCPVRDLANVG